MHCAKYQSMYLLRKVQLLDKQDVAYIYISICVSTTSVFLLFLYICLYSVSDYDRRSTAFIAF